MKKLAQFFSGLVISIIICLIPVFVIFGMFGGIRGSNAGTGLALLLPVLGGGTLVFVFVSQLIATVIFTRKSKDWSVYGIWSIYFIAIAVYASISSYELVRTKMSANSEYLARVLKPTLAPTENLFVFPRYRSRLRVGECFENCINLLRAGYLRTIGTPSEDYEVPYILLRHAEGDTCRLAQSNSNDRHKFALESKYKGIEASWKYVNSEDYQESFRFDIKYKNKIDEKYNAIRPEYRTSIQRIRLLLRQTKMLEAKGYFGGCIIAQHAETFDYDIRINRGKSFHRAFGPCCNIADIYERRSGSDVLLGRWESGDPRGILRRKIGAKRTGEYFAISDVVSVLKSVPIERNLQPVAFGSIETELKRLSDLSAKGTYFSSKVGPAGWIRTILQQHRSRTKATKIELSDNQKNSLRIIMLSLAGPDRLNHFKTYEWYLSKPDVDELLAWIDEINAKEEGQL